MNALSLPNPSPALSLPVLLLVLSGCCSPGVRPEQANLFQAACGISSGQYKADLQAAEAEAQRSAAAKDASAKENTRLQLQAQDKQQQLSLMQARLEALRGETEALQRVLEAESAAKAKQDAGIREKQQQLSDIRAALNRLQATHDAGESSAADSEELQALRSEVATLRQIVLSQ
ncbi:hypothetical protein Q4485_08005 [Granulosicoccaceae sp. 1_MG-2023]|nr:hypothetical protein [Granulosicoccaceae sp. 1_MG-2023]